jgi:hypothetical protein
LGGRACCMLGTAIALGTGFRRSHSQGRSEVKKAKNSAPMTTSAMRTSTPKVAASSPLTAYSTVEPTPSRGRLAVTSRFIGSVKELRAKRLSARSRTKPTPLMSR